MRLKTTRLLLTAFLLAGAPASFAELADREKPINLEADQVTVDDAQQISTFTGNVRLSQGSLLILGDKIVVMQDKEGFMQVTAYGKTASFRQKREGLDGYVEGYGERIEYNARAETMLLHAQARLKRDLDEVQGEHITYSSKTEVFQVNADGTSPENVRPKRVRAVLQPRQKEDAASAPAPGAPVTPSDNVTPAK